jgi:hypothetical protein
MGKDLVGTRNITEDVAIGFVTVTPTFSDARLQVKGSGSSSATDTVIVKNSSDVKSLIINDAGQISTGTGTTPSIFTTVGQYHKSYNYTYGWEFAGSNNSNTTFSIASLNLSPTSLRVTSASTSTGSVYGIFSSYSGANASYSFSIYGSSVGASTQAYGIYGTVNTNNGKTGDAIGVGGFVNTATDVHQYGGNFTTTQTVATQTKNSYGIFSRSIENIVVNVTGNVIGGEFSTTTSGVGTSTATHMAINVPSTSIGGTVLGADSPIDSTYMTEIHGNATHVNGLLIKGSGATTATTNLALTNSSGNYLMLVSDSGNISMGNVTPLSTSRLYVHSTTGTHGLNVNHSNTTGTAYNTMTASANGIGNAAYNYFNAAGYNNFARGVWGNSTGIFTEESVGVWGSANSGTVYSIGVYGTVSGGNTSNADTTGGYFYNGAGYSLNKIGVASVVAGPPSNSISYGVKTDVSIGTIAISNSTLYGHYIQVTGRFNQTSISHVGLYIDVDESSSITPVKTRAIETVAGDVELGYLATGGADEYVTVDSTGVLGKTTLTALTKYAADLVYVANTALTVTHSLNTTDVLYSFKDSAGEAVEPDSIVNFTATTMDVTFTIAGTYRTIVGG